MAFSFLPSTKKIGNIIIKDHVVRYLELRQANPPVIQKFGEHDLPEGLIRDGKIADAETLAMIMEECLDDWGVKRGKHPIRFTIPDHYVIVRKVAIPKEVAVDEIEGYIYIELGSTIHLPFEDPVFDYTFLSQTGNEKQILLFAAPEVIVREYVDFFNGFHLNPVAADLSPLCVYRAFYHLNAINPADHILLLQFDLTAVNAAVFHQHYPFLTREIEIDLPVSKWESSTDAFGEKKYRWPEKDPTLRYEIVNLMKELDRIVNYYQFSIRQGKAKITKILLNGDYPYLSKMEHDLTEQIGLPVETLRTEMVSTSAGAGFSARYAPVLGLALKEVN
ncbi:type IV pilus biogenesis protein PilM [Heyndrickxia acidiproducens]|uniref:type IV pilus biogenesis protein PilM n=1 Tax=Heyndrickxia acidiproducens TaxID=1121084 RepID=UPI000365B6C5|nr:pilus assembly protein PilM [Heyndrickxia acidiproducens]